MLTGDAATQAHLVWPVPLYGSRKMTLCAPWHANCHICSVSGVCSDSGFFFKWSRPRLPWEPRNHTTILTSICAVLLVRCLYLSLLYC